MDEKQDQEGVGLEETDGCRISVEMGRTYNLGNYESFNIRVGVVWPCMLAGREEAFKEAFDWVRGKLSAATPARLRGK